MSNRIEFNRTLLPDIMREEVEEEAEVEEEKRAFKKIFYKPTKATLSLSKEQVDAFQEEHKMNLTGINYPWNNITTTQG